MGTSDSKFNLKFCPVENIKSLENAVKFARDFGAPDDALVRLHTRWLRQEVRISWTKSK